MNILIDTPKEAKPVGGQIVVTMESGTTFSIPLYDFERLSRATGEQLAEIELSPLGLHWPQLDEDLAIGPLRREYEER
jgi:hypothetical protein